MPRLFLLLCCLLGIVGYAALLYLGAALGGMGDGFGRKPQELLSNMLYVVIAGAPFVYFILTGIWCVQKYSRPWLRSAAIISHLGLIPLLGLLLVNAFIPFGAPALFYFFASLYTLLNSDKKEPTADA